ncbi:hypothetical protein BGX20_000871 [Mortierella sp. AD010]|nr:hypothetical protein BGX20_000871 [Mortierella sp. AD010]
MLLPIIIIVLCVIVFFTCLKVYTRDDKDDSLNDPDNITDAEIGLPTTQWTGAGRGTTAPVIGRFTARVLDRWRAQRENRPQSSESAEQGNTSDVVQLEIFDSLPVYEGPPSSSDANITIELNTQGQVVASDEVELIMPPEYAQQPPEYTPQALPSIPIALPVVTELEQQDTHSKRLKEQVSRKTKILHFVEKVRLQSMNMSLPPWKANNPVTKLDDRLCPK